MPFCVSELMDFTQNSHSYWIQGVFELIVMKVEQP